MRSDVKKHPSLRLAVKRSEKGTGVVVQNMNSIPRSRLGQTPGLITTNGSRLMVGGTHIGMYVPFDALEPKRPATEHTMVQFVGQLNRDDALLMCGFLNCVTSGSGTTKTLERQRSAYASLFVPGDAEKIDDWIATQKGEDGIILLFRGQLLELMRWVARYSPQEPGTGRSFDHPETRQNFIRAAFLASDLWAARTFSDKLKGAVTRNDALDRALGAFRKGVEEAGPAMHIGVAMARGEFLFKEFLPTRLPTFFADFEAAMGLTIEDYVLCAGMLMTKVFDKPTDGYFFRPTYANATMLDAKFSQFLAVSSQDAASLARGLWTDFEKFGFKAIRDRPILLTSSGQCIVLDPTFFIDYFTVSPVFRVFGVSRPAMEVFSAFGAAFEDYAISILKRIYPERPPLVKRLYTNVLHREANPLFQIDAVINDAVELVIMEMKSAFIREDSVLSPDPKVFLNDLRKRYAVSDDPNAREKGVAQLAKSIRAIIIDRWSKADIDQGQIKRIFPVLLVHDERMGSPGIGVFLNRIFMELLGDIGNRVIVAPLAVMTIADLENVESSEFHMRELLAAYAADSGGSMISLHNFMATNSVFKDKLRPSEALRAKSLEFTNNLQRTLFPETGEPEAPINSSS
jgi:hypothetical protein